MSEPTLAEILADWRTVLAIVGDILEKRVKAKAARNKQAQHVSDGANNVPGYGTLAASNPTDSAIDGWSESEIDTFANACHDHAASLQAGGGN